MIGPITKAKELPWQGQKRIFLLTDGQVGNRQDVINISHASYSMRMHSFGIGDDCDQRLVNEVARMGRGSSSIVGDDRSHLVGSKIILALEKAFEPSLRNC